MEACLVCCEAAGDPAAGVVLALLLRMSSGPEDMFKVGGRLVHERRLLCKPYTSERSLSICEICV
jgi:hypothetical protein